MSKIVERLGRLTRSADDCGDEGIATLTRDAAAHIETLEAANKLNAAQVAGLRARVEQLEAELRFYANAKNWERRVGPYGDGQNYPPMAHLDNGEKARAALEDK